MTIEIIKAGKAPDLAVQKKYKATCPNCSTIFKLSEDDLVFYGGKHFAKCPICHFPCNDYDEFIDLTESIRRIKQTVEWFPGLVLGLDRRVGKTTAILQMLGEHHRAQAFYFCPNQNHVTQALHDWGGESIPELRDKMPRFVCEPMLLRGST